MQIIIVGCGKVGYTLVEQLSGEEHDIVVVDQNPARVHAITEELDAMGIVGNGVSFQTLSEAGLKRADLLIAVTGSDEQNLLCCVIAKKTGHCRTIARVRNPIFNKEVEFLKNELGISMIINPEMAAAAEIARIFMFPSAVKIDTFAKGHVELLHFRLGKDSPLNDSNVLSIHTVLHCEVLVCTVVRDDRVIIPNGDFVFREGDRVSIAAEPKKALHFFKRIGIATDRVTNAYIAGGGKISYYLTEKLLKSGIDTTIVEVNKDRCEFLSERFPKATIICGDATEQKILLQEGLAQADGFAALTDLDEENILLALYAKQVSHAKTATKVNRLAFMSTIDGMNLDSVFYPRLITADYIAKFVRSLSNSINSNVENLYKLADGKAEALEFIIKEDSEVTNIPLMNLKIKKNILICCIYREQKVIIPGGQDMIMAGDSVVVILANHRISDIKEILED